MLAPVASVDLRPAGTSAECGPSPRWRLDAAGSQGQSNAGRHALCVGGDDGTETWEATMKPTESTEQARTSKYWFLGPPRARRRRAVSAAAAATTALMAAAAAAAGVLLALTQRGVDWVGWGWAAWTLVVAWVGGRLVYDALRGPSRRV